jgi:hypothetical protein
MYYPYLRGKQFELMTLRECATYMSEKIVPIIEPVKKSLSTLKRSIDSLIDEDVSFIFIMNPKVGDFKENSNNNFLEQYLRTELFSYNKLQLGFIIDAKTDTQSLESFILDHSDYNLALIHNGFSNGQRIRDAIGETRILTNIYIEENAGKLYQKYVRDNAEKNILIRDGFLRRKNADHPEVEHFSELHITFRDEKMDGFGDFLIVGNEYMESGGPAFAVAIHLTFLNEYQDMLIRHFISDRTETPVDPAGKFIEALQKMVNAIRNREFIVHNSNALQECFELFRTEHFPGLGYVKKLSMNHHIELIANYLENNP